MTTLSHHSTVTTDRQVTVDAPARLHLGFLDLHGGLGRRFGSLGLALEELSTHLRITPAATLHASGPGARRAMRYADRILRRLELDGSVHITLERGIPEHAGLGSGTQLSLAIGTAISRLFGTELTTRELGDLLDRGQRSGIGLGAFEQGGFLVDGGRGPHSAAPPIVAQTGFPPAWRVVLVLDRQIRGLHGDREQQAFRQLPAFSALQAAELCRIALMQVMPALLETDFPAFSAGVGAIQDVVGDYFATAQGGRYTSPRVARVLDRWRSQGVRGTGQSSWGPTGFAFAASAAEAQALIAAVAQSDSDGIELRAVSARNEGCRLTTRAPRTHCDSIVAARKRA